MTLGNRWKEGLSARDPGQQVEPHAESVKRAETIIRSIPAIIKMAVSAGCRQACVMEDLDHLDFRLGGDLTRENLRGAAAMVFDHCVAEGLSPAILGDGIRGDKRPIDIYIYAPESR